MTAPVDLALLTPRQGRICHLITQGFTDLEISENLGIGRRTVEDHRRKIFHKFDVQNAVDLVRKIFA